MSGAYGIVAGAGYHPARNESWITWSNENGNGLAIAKSIWN